MINLNPISTMPPKDKNNTNKGKKRGRRSAADKAQEEVEAAATAEELPSVATVSATADTAPVAAAETSVTNLPVVTTSTAAPTAAAANTNATPERVSTPSNDPSRPSKVARLNEDDEEDKQHSSCTVSDEEGEGESLHGEVTNLKLYNLMQVLIRKVDEVCCRQVQLGDKVASLQKMTLDLCKRSDLFMDPKYDIEKTPKVFGEKCVVVPLPGGVTNNWKCFSCLGRCDDPNRQALKASLICSTCTSRFGAEYLLCSRCNNLEPNFNHLIETAKIKRGEKIR